MDGDDIGGRAHRAHRPQLGERVRPPHDIDEHHVVRLHPPLLEPGRRTPGGRYSTRCPSGPVTAYPVPGASMATARTRCPVNNANSRPSGTRPGCGNPAGTSTAGPS